MANGAILGQIQSLSQAIAALYGLGANATPNDAFEILSKAALYKTVTQTAQLGTLPEGSIIYLNENGSPVPFYVAKQGYEPSYNSNRVLVVRRDGSTQGPWNSSGVNTYDGSTIDTWFNQTYLQTLDNDVQTAIGMTSIPATSPRNSGVIRLNKSVFALSLTELGEARENANTEGSAVSISSVLNTLTLSEENVGQWTRSPYTVNETSVWVITPHGGSATTATNNTTYAYRPAFTLPETFQVHTAVGLYDMSDNLLLKLPGVQIATGSYVGTGTYGSSNPNSLTADFQIKFAVVIRQEAVNPSYSGEGFVWAGQPGSAIESGDFCSFVPNGNELKYYAASAQYQFNTNGRIYFYVLAG